MANRDDDDWVGEPPEGRHSRERADPGHWNRGWQPVVAGSITGLLLIVLLLVVLL